MLSTCLTAGIYLILSTCLTAGIYLILSTCLTAGILWEDYPEVRDQRNFAIRILKDRGMGKRELEPLLQEEIQEFLSKMHENENKPFDFAPYIHLAITNVIASVVFGKRYDYEDEEFAALIKSVEESLQASIKMSSTKNIPFIKWIPFDASGRKMARRNNLALRAYLGKIIREHRNSLDRENPIDYIDQYLLKMEEEKDNLESLFQGKKRWHMPALNG